MGLGPSGSNILPGGLGPIGTLGGTVGPVPARHPTGPPSVLESADFWWDAADYSDGTIPARAGTGSLTLATGAAAAVDGRSIVTNAKGLIDTDLDLTAGVDEITVVVALRHAPVATFARLVSFETGNGIHSYFGANSSNQLFCRLSDGLNNSPRAGAALTTGVLKVVAYRVTTTGVGVRNADGTWSSGAFGALAGNLFGSAVIGVGRRADFDGSGFPHDLSALVIWTSALTDQQVAAAAEALLQEPS